MVESDAVWKACFLRFLSEVHKESEREKVKKVVITLQLPSVSYFFLLLYPLSPRLFICIYRLCVILFFARRKRKTSNCYDFRMVLDAFDLSLWVLDHFGFLRESTSDLYFGTFFSAAICQCIRLYCVFMVFCASICMCAGQTTSCRAISLSIWF